ncbi:MAG TPA: sulfatase [Myxococcota bacterium]|nr:sulfatase [Myxococcota bacterium]
MGLCWRLLAGFVGVMCLGASAARAETPAHPNIVFIMTEDMNPRLGAYGDPIARTPRIDRLARESVRFTNAFTTAPVCAPSRAALITGLYAQSFGAQHMRTSRAWDEQGNSKTFEYLAVPPPEVKAFPELLRRAGWFTSNHRKTDYQFGDPFTVWDTFAPEAMIGGWRGAAPDQPFFAMINPEITHEGMIWPPRTPEEAAKRPQVTDPNSVVLSPFIPDTPVTRLDLARHYDNIATLDGQVGAILDALQADGLLDHTIVIFTADHGDGLPHAKRNLYDWGLHVPLLVRFPDGRDAGTVRTDLVSFIDLAPTILRLAGVAVPSEMRGQVFLGPERAPDRSYAFAAADRMEKIPSYWRSARDLHFQYLANHMPERPLFEPLKFRDIMPTMQELWRLHAGHQLTPLQESQFSAPRPREELYDVVADPDETRNLADDPNHAGDLARMRAALDEFESRTPDLSKTSERTMARHLWPGLKQPRTEKPIAKRRKTPDGPVFVLHCKTPGASIGYRLASDPPKRWRLYVAPVPAREPIEAKAVRYGWAESRVARASP